MHALSGSTLTLILTHQSLRIQVSRYWIWDSHTSDLSGVGNIHGMPLAFLTSCSGSTSLGGSTDSQPVPFSWLDSVHLRPTNLAYIGLRDVDQGEKAIIRKHNIAAFSMHEVDRYGIGKVVEMALDRINPDRSKPIHLSFDVDALDPSVAPSTGTPVRGGLTFREGHYICERLYETGLLVAFDLMVCEYRRCWLRFTSLY